MATNPLIAQGSLNRLIGSVSVPSFPGLNVTAPFLGKAAIRLAIEGESTKFIETMTGVVTSPEPYMMVRCTVNLLKPQSLADRYKAQMVSSSLIGGIVVRPDVSAGLSPFDINNCAIQSVRELAFDGEDAGFDITIGGYWIVNNNLWNMQ